MIKYTTYYKKKEKRNQLLNHIYQLLGKKYMTTAIRGLNYEQELTMSGSYNVYVTDPATTNTVTLHFTIEPTSASIEATFGKWEIAQAEAALAQKKTDYENEIHQLVIAQYLDEFNSTLGTF